MISVARTGSHLCIESTLMSVLAADMRTTSYWLDGIPEEPLLQGEKPNRVDVAIVGAGYTGLSAALELARSGRSVAVFDSERPGYGCSTRNGGQVSPHMKPSMVALARRAGDKKAFAVRKTGYDAYEYLSDFIRAEGIECDFERSGHFLGAHTPGAYEAIARSEPEDIRQFGYEAYAIPRSDQRSEVGTDAFFGGVVYPQWAKIDPARYHHGLLTRANDAGALVFGNSHVESIQRDGKGFHLRVGSAQVHARDVLVATNGYTGPSTPWMRRRVIPIGSFIIATEPQPESLIRRLSPKDRMISETRKVVYYYRASPDRRRILFGGRVSIGDATSEYSAPRLHAAMTRVFPELSGAKVSHCWYGFVAYTFDELPHIGSHDSVHYAMGYCGTGIAMATYLGMKSALKILGRPQGATALDDLPFQTRPGYFGKPWFLAPSILYYKMRDAMMR